jgi:hypothetical protein
MSDAEFEQAYERLAAALDALPAEQESDLLARLALLLAARCADLETFEAALAAAVEAGAIKDS